MIPRRSQRHPAEKINDLDFADDIVELEESLEKAQSQLDLLSLTAKEVGLYVNTTKTKLITCNIPHSSLKLDGEDIENVEDFQYLGSYIASTGKDIKCRKGKAWSAFWKLDRVRKSPASLQQKVQLFKTSALSVLLYGCEFWVLTTDLCRQRDSFQTSCLRIILGVSCTDHESNEEVYDRTETVPLSQSVKARQIRFLGHCLRRPQGDLISKYALNHPTHGKPRPGGRKILFHEYAAKLISPPPPPSRSPSSRKSYFGTGPQSLEAHGEAGCWHHWERLSRAERALFNQFACPPPPPQPVVLALLRAC